jgi:hypothetical protein
VTRPIRQDPWLPDPGPAGSRRRQSRSHPGGEGRCLGASGKAREKVYNVAWGGAEKRRLVSDGKLPPVGSSVNEKQATYGNSIGDPFLQTYWQDPDLDPSQQAFYYVRVLEISTPRWLAYDAKFYKLKLPSVARLSSQERAYTSPFWYSPVLMAKEPLNRSGIALLAQALPT